MAGSFRRASSRGRWPTDVPLVVVTLGEAGCVVHAARALVWTVEELGELAQAVRRGEGPARLEEELGQLTAWMLCLANILDVDLGAAVEAAVCEEIGRQVAKYGRLVPCQPS
jgi:NTP pyrophosphatase (non-canonical NTP hydrolase)